MMAYVRKDDILNCIQYTGDNRAQVIQALNIDKANCQRWMNTDTKENYLVVAGCNEKILPSSWVAHQGTRVWIIPSELFKRDYQLVTI